MTKLQSILKKDDWTGQDAGIVAVECFFRQTAIPAQYADYFAAVKEDPEKNAVYTDYCCMSDWLRAEQHLAEAYAMQVQNTAKALEKQTELVIFAERAQTFLSGVPKDIQEKADRDDVFRREEVKKHSLEVYFLGAHHYDERAGNLNYPCEYLSRARKQCIEGYRFVLGYNYMMDKIAKFRGVPCVLGLKYNILDLKYMIMDYNDNIEMLAGSIAKQHAPAREKAFKENFQPIDFNAITIPDNAKKKANKMIKNYNQFTNWYGGDDLENVLCR